MKATRIMVLVLMVSSTAFAGEPASGICTKSDSPTRVSDMRSLLNTFTALAEEHIAGIQRTLMTLAVTEEAVSGDWNLMKRPLAEFGRSGIDPVAVWYVRTDGSYYTVEKGLTDQNISDRPYFSRLMAGHSAAGDLVISRSTGKRAAVIAVPVFRDGRVIGALGVSISSDNVSRALQEKMSLPKDMVFYALDGKGQTSLHKETSRLFAFPSDMGSKTLREAVREMLSKQEGTVRYDFNGERIVVFKKSNFTGWVFAIGIATGTAAGSAGDEVPPILSELGSEVGFRLSKIDADLSVAAKGLSGAGLDGPGARKILNELCGSVPYSADCATVDSTGRMLAVEPGAYRKFEGADISRQEQIVRLHNSKKPVMSEVIRSVEGFDAVDIEHPVFSLKGEFVGSVSVLIRPESLMSDVAATFVQGLPIDVWVMQKDGRIIYDPDEEEIGRMLFDDPIYKPYPKLLSLGVAISKERSGSGSYDFLGKGLKEPVKKDAYWTTTGLYGTEWRLVVTHTLAEESPYAKRDLEELGVKSCEESLRDLAEQRDLKEALAGKEGKKIQGVFKKFHNEHYGIYAIQWVDALGVSRYGYPEENSPIDFDFHSMKTPSSRYILKALSEQKETSFDAPLIEGKEGRFFMVPVRRGDIFLGMVYVIRIRP